MLTKNLQQIKDHLENKSSLTEPEEELLGIIKHMDQLEQHITSHKNLEDSQQIISTIIRPGAKTCKTCGRTLK